MNKTLDELLDDFESATRVRAVDATAGSVGLNEFSRAREALKQAYTTAAHRHSMTISEVLGARFGVMKDRALAAEATRDSSARAIETALAALHQSEMRTAEEARKVFDAGRALEAEHAARMKVEADLAFERNRTDALAGANARMVAELTAARASEDCAKQNAAAALKRAEDHPNTSWGGLYAQRDALADEVLELRHKLEVAKDLEETLDQARALEAKDRDALLAQIAAGRLYPAKALRDALHVERDRLHKLGRDLDVADVVGIVEAVFKLTPDDHGMECSGPIKPPSWALDADNPVRQATVARAARDQETWKRNGETGERYDGPLIKPPARDSGDPDPNAWRAGLRNAEQRPDPPSEKDLCGAPWGVQDSSHPSAKCTKDRNHAAEKHGAMVERPDGGVQWTEWL